jgi:hypothetical protein
MRWWTPVFVLLGAGVGWAAFQRGRGAGWIVLTYAAAVGVLDRIVRVPFLESDVMPATDEAIRTLRQGQNPYTHFYLSTIPPGYPFPYPPGEVLFYAIPKAVFGQISDVDRWAGIVIVLLLASLAFSVGTSRAALATALYATFGLAAFLALDGSNDTSLALLLTAAIVLLAWSERGLPCDRFAFLASAVAFSWALLFKQFAWVIYPFILLHLIRSGRDWRRHALVTLVPFGVLMLFFALQDPAGFVGNVVAGTTHPDVFGINLWAGFAAIAPGLNQAVNPWITILGVLAIAITAVPLLLRPGVHLGTAVMQGLAVLFVVLFFARWTAAPYYAGTAALLAIVVALAGIDLTGGVPGVPGVRTLRSGFRTQPINSSVGSLEDSETVDPVKPAGSP